MNSIHHILFASMLAASVGPFVGCSNQTGEFKEYTQAETKAGDAHDHDGDEHHHDHDHAHHHHGGPHEGRLVEIGHTHHEHDDKVTFYFAEVMPIDDGTLTFHLVSEAEGSGHEMIVFPSEEEEITAIINGQGDDALSAFEVSLAAIKDKGASGFTAALPEALHGKQLTVVVPKIVLGGERMDFSFEAGGDDAREGEHDHDHSHSNGEEHHPDADHDDHDHPKEPGEQ